MGKWGLLCKIEDQMRTISAVWSSWGPSPQLRTFTKALNRGTNFWVMIYPAISSPSSQGCIKSSLPFLFRSDSFTMFTSYEQFQNILLVIYSFGSPYSHLLRHVIQCFRKVLNALRCRSNCPCQVVCIFAVLSEKVLGWGNGPHESHHLHKIPHLAHMTCVISTALRWLL